ncbi:unnamed protein product [Dibothriocephalus latus]|uniref:Uncharacterized protein n=1 Tax=Dibothriocephalus latus TaxID=60516 RepID=A0A3P7NKA3_DIBLA|nr:unnamed protein product [Dibothriocephalus latus]
MSFSTLPDYIDLESLFDTNRRIRKDDFLSVMEFEDANPKKFKRIIQQCMRVMEEFGPWCADMVGVKPISPSLLVVLLGDLTGNPLRVLRV